MSRRQKRAKQNTSNTKNVQSVNDIHYARPDTNTTHSKPAKTLLQIAAEKQAQLIPGSKLDTSNVLNVTVDQDGNIIPLSPSNPANNLSNTADGIEQLESTEISPWLDSLFLSISLSLIHFTLSTLTMHQYAQELSFLPLIRTTLFTAFPTLFLIIHLFHGHLLPLRTSSLSEAQKSMISYLRQGLLLGIACASGCYLIYLTNDKGYYAVMKNAPGIGTLWVFAILELRLVGALLGVLGPGVYAWRMGYGVL